MRLFTFNNFRSIFAAWALLIVSCSTPSDEKEKLLVRKWAYKEFKMNNESMTGEQMGNPVMEFLADGKYKVEIGGILEEGVWKIEKEELVTTTKPKEGETEKTNRLKIHELTNEKLVLFSDAGGNKAYVTLIPYSQN